MTDIRIDDLQPTETELLTDDESYMGELLEDELGLVAGGVLPIVAVAKASSAACAGGAIGFSVGLVEKVTR